MHERGFIQGMLCAGADVEKVEREVEGGGGPCAILILLALPQFCQG